MTKYVYDFSEGNKDMKDLLGGKGANLAEMTNMGLPVPPGFTITTEACLTFLRRGRRARRDAATRPASTCSTLEDAMGKTPRRPRRPAARERALGREVLDARDDGHGPQPRAQRRVGEGPRDADRRRRAVRARRLPPVHPDVRQDRHGRAGRRLRGRARRGEGSAKGASAQDTDLDAEDLAAADRPVQGDLPRAHRRGLPAGPQGAAAAGDRRGVPQLERQARDRLPAAEQDQRRPRHRGERAVDGVRQPRRRLRHRRGVHARPVHRREGALRRLPGERAGRGRRGGHPQHAAARRARAGRPRRATRGCAR